MYSVDANEKKRFLQQNKQQKTMEMSETWPDT